MMKTHLNLLSERFRYRQLIKLRLCQWGAVLAVSVIVLGFIGWAHWSDCETVANRRTLLESEYEPLKRLMSDSKALRGKLDDLQKEEAIALAISQDRPVLSLIGLVSEAARKSGGKVYVEDLTLGDSAGDPSGRQGTTTAGRQVLALKGVGTSNVAVAQFAAAIRDAGLFRGVELKSTGTTKVGQREVRSFRMECAF